MPAPKIFTGKTAKSVIAIPPTDKNQWQLSGVSAKYVTPIFHAVSEGIDELCDALRDTEQNTVSTEQRGIVNLEGADYKFTLNMSVTLNDFVCNSNTKQYTYSNLRLNYDFSYDGYTRRCKINEETIYNGVFRDFQDGGMGDGNTSEIAIQIIRNRIQAPLTDNLEFVAEHLLERQIKPIKTLRKLHGSQKVKLAKQLIKLAKELLGEND